MINKKTVRSIGIFDSGIGGYNILKMVLPLPLEKIIYLQDRKNLPYGDKSPEFILNATKESLNFLESQQVDDIIIACHTASAICSSFGPLENIFPAIPLIGMIDLVTEDAAKRTKNGRIGILATTATTNSHQHKKNLLRLNSELKIIEQACPDLVPAIENHQTAQKVAVLIEQYCAPLKDAGVDTVILGCTHYSFIRDQIQNYMGDHVTLIAAQTHIAQKLYEKFNFSEEYRKPTLITYEHTKNGYQAKPLIIHQHLL